MKKFLIFLVSIVVVVCVGLTTYYFMRNNEIITIKTKEIYCNAGDSIPLASLGIEMEKKNISKKTTFDYNAGGEDVTKYIQYDAESDSYVVSNENAGEVTLVISTTNKKYPDFKIKVHIGNGSVQNPYYIFTESELNRIGNIYRLDKSYKLMNDITLSKTFKPVGFNGVFDGQGYTIKGLNIENFDSTSVGLFSKLNSNAQVKNLMIAGANISGEYEHAGVLAGVVEGNVEKVAVKNSTISNVASVSKNGAIAGSFAGNALKLSYADNVTINVGAEDVESQSVIGGLIGDANQSNIKACYANNVTINVANSEAVVGGLIGRFSIGNQTGSIQQSYSNATSTYEDFGAFIGEIKTIDGFNAEEANLLRYLIGNIAVVYGAENSQAIDDVDLVSTYNTEFFKNSTYADRSVFFEEDSAMYLIRGFASAGEVVATNEYVYYALDMNTLTHWDTTYVWNVENNSLPTLKMGEIYPTDPIGDYFRRNLAQQDLGNTETFIHVFGNDVEDKSIKLLDNVDLTSGWTPVAIKNTTIDGNNKTITINLNNANDSKLGLFTTVDNSTIKNLNIVVTGVSANATDAGALAGLITSTDSMTTSSIENVTITYQGFSTPAITNFGGIAGTIENVEVSNVTVSGLNINSGASVENSGALAGIINSNAKISNSKVENITAYGTTEVAGLAAENSGVLTGISGTVSVKYASAKAGKIAGIVAVNNGSIDNVQLNIHIEVGNFANDTKVGGISAVNNGTISNITISGDSIQISGTSKIYVGAIVAENNNNISNVVNRINSVGTYAIDANHYVAGVAAINSGNITKVLTQSNLYGNYVSGVVAKMDTISAVIDQVVVGKYNQSDKTLAKNEIKGDKYLAGISVEFYAGTIKNVQSASAISGTTTSTRSSLAVLIFPYGANLTHATIDSSLEGYGIKYRETWTDFGVYPNKAEFGMQNIGTDARFDIYKYDAVHGCMQSVVINYVNFGVLTAKNSMGSAFLFISKDYADTAESSFVKTVYGFNDISQFQGQFTFVCAIDTTGAFKHEATRELTFAIGSVWESNNGISLMFLNNIVA